MSGTAMILIFVDGCFSPSCGQCAISLCQHLVDWLHFMIVSELQSYLGQLTFLVSHGRCWYVLSRQSTYVIILLTAALDSGHVESPLCLHALVLNFYAVCTGTKQSLRPPNGDQCASV